MPQNGYLTHQHPLSRNLGESTTQDWLLFLEAMPSLASEFILQ